MMFYWCSTSLCVSIIIRRFWPLHWLHCSFHIFDIAAHLRTTHVSRFLFRLYSLLGLQVVIYFCTFSATPISLSNTLLVFNKYLQQMLLRIKLQGHLRNMEYNGLSIEYNKIFVVCIHKKSMNVKSILKIVFQESWIYL